MAHMLFIFGIMSSGLHTASAQACMVQLLGLATKCPTDAVNFDKATPARQQEIIQAICDPGECKTAADKLLLDCPTDSTVQENAGVLLALCVPCTRKMIALSHESGGSDKCPNTALFESTPSASQIEKLCSTDCKSTMNSAAAACEESPDPAMQQVAGNISLLMSLCDGCTQSFMSLSANCKEGGTNDGPNLEAGCGDCRTGFEALTAACPGDVTKSPIPGVLVEEYNQISSAIEAKLKTCPTTGSASSSASASTSASASAASETATTPGPTTSGPTEADGAFRHGVVAAAALSLACICF